MSEYPYTLVRLQTHTAEVNIDADSEPEADAKADLMIAELNSLKDDILTPQWELQSDEYQLE